MTDQTFTVSLDPHPAGATVLRFAGELDHHTAPRARAVLDAIPLGPDAGLVVDVTDLDYCDSTGITVLIAAYRRAQDAGSPYGLAGLNRDLRRVFQIIGLDNLFPLHPTVDEAIDSQLS